MLVGLHDNPKHLRRLQALLIDQPLSNAQQLGERVLHDLVKLLALLSSLKSVHTTNGQQALQTRIDSVRIVSREQLKVELKESRPLLGEVVLQNLLEEGNQLGADIGRRRGQGRDKSLPESGLLGFRNGSSRRTVFDRGPSSADTVLQVDTSWEAGLATLSPQVAI